MTADSYSTRRALSNGARHFARDAREVERPDLADPAATMRTNNHFPHPLGVWGNFGSFWVPIPRPFQERYRSILPTDVGRQTRLFLQLPF